jgi:signal transduction histidine kinase
MDRLTTPASFTGEAPCVPSVTTPPLVAALAHDLKLPLQAVLGWVSRLRHHEVTPERRDAVLAIIEKNTLLLGGLVGELLDVATGQRWQGPMARGPLNLTELIARAVEGLRPTAEREGVTLHVSEASPIVMHGNEAGLMRVVGNLLSNAIRFSRAGGVVVCTVREEHGGATLVVRDYGRGIGSEFLPHVFEPFSSEYGCGGSGLGLSVVQDVVRQHGGSVRAESAGREQGATFIVTLPCKSMAKV